MSWEVTGEGRKSKGTRLTDLRGRRPGPHSQAATFHWQTRVAPSGVKCSCNHVRLSRTFLNCSSQVTSQSVQYIIIQKAVRKVRSYLCRFDGQRWLSTCQGRTSIWMQKPKPGPFSRAHTHWVNMSPSCPRCWPGHQTQADRPRGWSSPSGAVGAQNCQQDGATASLWECAQKAGARGWGRLSEEAERRQRHQEHSDGDSTGSLGRHCGSEAADQPRSTSDGLLPAKVCRWSAAHRRPDKLAGEWGSRDETEDAGWVMNESVKKEDEITARPQELQGCNRGWGWGREEGDTGEWRGGAEGHFMGQRAGEHLSTSALGRLPLPGDCTPDACSHCEEPAQGLARKLKRALLSATTVVVMRALRSQPCSCTIQRNCGIKAELHILLFMSGLHKDWLFGSTRSEKH